MQISQRFEITRPCEQVWEIFQDVPRVAQCIPGAKLLNDRGDGHYAGVVETRLGPITAVFEGEGIHIVDPDSWSGCLEGTGADRRAGSRAKAKIDYRLTVLGATTQVDVEADITLSGAAAQFGRPGLVRELSARILRDFAANVEAQLARGDNQEHNVDDVLGGDTSGTSNSEPPQMGGLLLSSIWGWLCAGLQRLTGKGNKA